MENLYTIGNKVNDKLYIGVSYKKPEDKLKEFIQKAIEGKSGKLYDAIREIGADKFYIKDNLALDSRYFNLDYLQSRAIAEEDSYYNGYNMNPGPCGNLRPKILEERDNMREILRGIREGREYWSF